MWDFFNTYGDIQTAKNSVLGFAANLGQHTIQSLGTVQQELSKRCPGVDRASNGSLV